MIADVCIVAASGSGRYTPLRLQTERGELGVPGNSLLDVQLPAAVALAAIAALGYLASAARHKVGQFSATDGLILVALMAIVTAAGIPVVNAISGQASESVLLQDLRTMRATIALYKAEHDGEVPLLYKGALPQLTEATNTRGEPGPSGAKYPYGPYLPSGIPANPSTGIAFISPTDVFPPTKPTGVGGWLYHQPSGRIAPDVKEHLND